MLIKTSEQNFCDIANSIRGLTGDATKAYKKSEMANAIDEYIQIKNGVSYTFDDTGNPLTATIFGSTVRGLGGTPSTLSISYNNPSIVNKIGKYAFYYSDITDYTIPETVKTIDEYAFYWAKMSNITLPNTLESIGKSAFGGCDNLKISKLPDNLISLGGWCFTFSENISINQVPSGITIIDDYTFNGCNAITSFTFHENITQINTRALGSCDGLTTVTFKGTPASISVDAFKYSDALTTINVPWAEGEVENAPWGATNATINYNYT